MLDPVRRWAWSCNEPSDIHGATWPMVESDLWSLVGGVDMKFPQVQGSSVLIRGRVNRHQSHRSGSWRRLGVIVDDEWLEIEVRSISGPVFQCPEVGLSFGVRGRGARMVVPDHRAVTWGLD